MATEGMLVQFMADDCVIETCGWDGMIKAHMPDDLIFSTMCHDGKRINDFHPCTSRRVIDAVGYYMPPCLKSYYGDPWISEVTKNIRRLVLLPELVIRHNHDLSDDAVRRKMKESAAEDKEMFRRFSYERMQASYKLAAVINGTR